MATGATTVAPPDLAILTEASLTAALDAAGSDASVQDIAQDVATVAVVVIVVTTGVAAPPAIADISAAVEADVASATGIAAADLVVVRTEAAVVAAPSAAPIAAPPTDPPTDIALPLAITAIVILLILAGAAFIRWKSNKMNQVMTEMKSSYDEQTRKSRLVADARGRQIAKLMKNLEQSRELVAKIAAEGGSQLSQYKISYAALSFDEPVNCLGEGSFGSVLKGVLTQPSRTFVVAVKTVRTTKLKQSAVRDFMHEIIVMAPLSHPGLVKLYGGCWDNPDELCIVLEFCPHGSLRDLFGVSEITLVDGGGLFSPLTWSTAYHGIMSSVAECFHYLHHEQTDGNPLIHRDLKPENLLIAEHNGRLVQKVADFGESRSLSMDEAQERKQQEGTETDAEGVLTMARAS